MCVLLGEFASPLSPTSPHEPFILLLLDGATWPGKKHSEILRLIWTKRREIIIFQISPWDFILMFSTNNTWFVFLQSSSQHWQLENNNWVSLPLEISSTEKKLLIYISQNRSACIFLRDIFAAALYQRVASEVSAANLVVGLSCWLGSQPPQLCFLNIKIVSCWYTYWNSYRKKLFSIPWKHI